VSQEPDTDAILRAFYGGETANRNGATMRSNPYAPESDELRYDAWAAGWLFEDGPVFSSTARARQDYKRATLGDLWPDGVSA
jgi:hypothetical protein